MGVGAALDQLRERGLRVLYSTALVDPALRTRRAVTGTDPAAVARAVLHSVGLELRAFEPGLFGVVEAQQGLRWRLAGRIVSAVDGAPLADARLELVEERFVAWSGATGEFDLGLLGRGPRTLRVSIDGFAPTAHTVQFPRSADAPLQLRLAPLAASLEEVTVVASRFTYESVERSGAFLLDQAAIVAQPKIGEDALQALSRLPGVSFSGFSARPNVRGGESSEWQVVLDDMPIRQPFHLPAYNAALSANDESLVERLDAYTGTVPSRFGNRLGAVVDLRSPIPGADRAAGPMDAPRAAARPRHALGLSSYHARLRTSRTAPDPTDVEWLLSARLGMAERWIERYAPDLGRPAYRDAFAGVTRTTAAGTVIGVRTLWSASVLDFVDPDTGETADLRSDAGYLWLSVARPELDGVALGATLGLSTIDSERRGTVEEGLTPFGELDDRRAVQLWDAQLRLNWVRSAAQAVEFGVTGSGGRGRYRYASEVEFEPVADLLFGVGESRERQASFAVSQATVGAFATLRQQLGERLFLEAGGRVDRDLGEQRPAGTWWSPRAALRWDASPRTRWRASLGRAFQREEVHEIRVEDGETTAGRPQRAEQAVLGVEHRLPAGVTLRLEGYARRIEATRARYENLFEPLRFLPELSADRVAVTPREARLVGAEASAQWETGAWSLWGAYTWSEANDVFADGHREARNWDQRHALTLAAQWRRGPWNASLLTQLRSGRPTTPLLEANLNHPRLGVRNSARLGGYASVDLRVSREFPLSVGRLLAYAQVTNLLNRRNPCCREIDLPDAGSGSANLETDPLQAYPAIPALGVQWEF